MTGDAHHSVSKPVCHNEASACASGGEPSIQRLWPLTYVPTSVHLSAATVTFDASQADKTLPALHPHRHKPW